MTAEIAAVQNVKEEFWATLMTGTVDPDKFIPQANEKFKAAGLDKIIAEAQSQIDAWKAANKKLRCKRIRTLGECQSFA